MSDYTFDDVGDAYAEDYARWQLERAQISPHEPEYEELLKVTIATSGAQLYRAQMMLHVQLNGLITEVKSTWAGRLIWGVLEALTVVERRIHAILGT